MARGLTERAQVFRETWLAPSGGWLADVTMYLSDLTGVWDLTILAGIFAGSWITIRTSPMEIALILGLGFDLTIPLQYQYDKVAQRRHASHLENYWPVLTIGCVAEGLCFFLLHPDLFTLVVCIKTTFMMTAWLGKDQEGLRVPRRSSRQRQPPGDHKVTHDGAGRSDEDPKVRRTRDVRSGGRPGRGLPSRSNSDPGDQRRRRKSSRENESDSESPSSPESDSSTADAADRPNHSKAHSSSSTTPSAPPNMPDCINVRSPYKYLNRAGYTDPAIAGMILAMNNADEETAKKNMRTWAKERDKQTIARRNKQYAERAKKAGWPGEINQGGGVKKTARNKPDSKPNAKPEPKTQTKLALPVESVRKVEAALKKTRLPAENQKAILNMLKNPKDERELEEVKAALKQIGIPIAPPGYGEPDGMGGYRDIVLRPKDVQALMRKAKKYDVISKSEGEKWERYLSEPRSRNEIERKVIPFAKRADQYIGDGYVGGGRHRLKPEKVLDLVSDLKKRLGVSQGMAEHMILNAINQERLEDGQAIIERWMSSGFTDGEYARIHKSLPDWA
ncbi:hypothetical protein IAU60_003090 [Kwoniella sp. DSM 27419]